MEIDQKNPTSDSAFASILNKPIRITPFAIAIGLIVLAAVVTRFVDLETRVMSHDESLHTQFSWYLSEGRGFSHDPLMHGPLQMHLVAFSYFLFGDSDASARFPAALAGVLGVILVILYYRWLGKSGAVLAAALMLISPYILYYSRYVRNEALIIPVALLMFYAVFRYFEHQEAKWLYLLAASLALHFTAKETAFIYTAQLLIFIGVYFAIQILKKPWPQASYRWLFIVGLITTGIGVATGLFALFRERAMQAEILPAEGVVSNVESLSIGGPSFSPVIAFALLLALTGLLLIFIVLILSFGQSLRTDFPSLDILIIGATVTLPLLAALPASLLGWDPLEYKIFMPQSPTFILVIFLMLVSAGIGLLWNWRKWLIAAGIFFGIFMVFYTTIFTNINGISSGLIGSLGYWLEQHGVERGGQPWFYYLFIQIPIYEYLLALGTLLAVYFGFKTGWDGEHLQGDSQEPPTQSFPVIGFLTYWAITSLSAYTFAGERMPWLTVHIAIPMVLLSGWGIAKYVGGINWRRLTADRGWIVALVLLLLLIATTRLIFNLLGTDSPFAGQELDQLRRTGGFIGNLLIVVVLVFALRTLSTGWLFSDLIKLAGGYVLAALMILTARTSLRAAFINYDRATEYLVYAHSATGVKTAIDQIEDLSIRLTDGKDLEVAFDDDVSWPMTWYLRDYSRQHYYGPNPTRELLNYPVILAGDNNWHLIEPLLGDRYHEFEYIRMWWPNQDYWNVKWSSIESEFSRLQSESGEPPTPMSLFEYLRLSWQHIRPFFTDPVARAAVWDIWSDRDFDKYGEYTQRDMSLTNWSPSDRMRLYIRKDVASQVWDYGLSPVSIEEPIILDPYEAQMQSIPGDLQIGQEGSGPGEFLSPRDVAFGPDGTMYVADTGNHRIQRLSPDGGVLNMWGGYGNLLEGPVPGGQFNEPWGIAVGEDGTVYVADTWNHRIQRFTPDGEFLGMFGSEGIGDSPEVFWGPRDVAVDRENRIYVSDTGNKWVKVFDAEGNFITQVGGAGYLPGYLDEPVGVDIAADGRLVVADTWNQRIQVFEEISANFFSPSQEWPMDAWFGQSLENKPYLAVNDDQVVCATDPEGFRVLCFTLGGEFLRGWGGDFGSGLDQFALINGIAFDPQGHVWVVDGGNHRILRFSPDLKNQTVSEE